MTAAVNVLAEQGRDLVAGQGTTPEVEVTQARDLVAAVSPATEVLAEQARYLVGSASPAVEIKGEQGRYLVAALGLAANNRMRAWGFTLDGHDFLAVTLGTTSTLVYDITTQSWSKWSNEGLGIWRAVSGLSWIGMGKTTLSTNAATKVVGGDYATGYLWTLDPYVGYDEDIDTLAENPFTREVIGGVPIRTRKTQPVGAAYLTVNSGDPQIIGSTFNLQTSVDNGNTWTDHGTITSTSGDFTQQFAWRSLGLIKTPGMAFKLTDNGAAVRVDSLEIR